MKGKKGLTRNAVVGLVITLLSLVVLVVFIYNIYYTTPTLIDKETCRMSVISRGNWVVKGLPDDVKPPLQCKTQPINIKTTNEQEIKREIANAMYDCWDMLGGGKIPFLGKDLADLTWINPDEPACLICATIEFSANVQNKIKKIEEFDAYLEETKIPRKEITYAEYLTDKQGAKIDLLDPAIAPVIETDKKQSVVFMAMKGVTLFEFLGPGTIHWPAMIGTQYRVAQLCEADPRGCMGIFVVPHESSDLNRLCGNLQSIP